MIAVTVQGKKRQKTVSLSLILNDLPDINVVCSMSVIDEKFIMDIQTYSPHLVVIDFDTPLKVRMDFFDILSLLKFKNPSIRIILTASKASVESFGKDKFHKSLETAKIYDCIVSDDKGYTDDRLRKIIDCPETTFENPFQEDIAEDLDSFSPPQTKRKQNTPVDFGDVELTPNIFTDFLDDFNSEKTTYSDMTSDVIDTEEYPQIEIGVTSFKNDGSSFAYSLEMANVLKSYGSVCVCSSFFEYLRNFHKIGSEYWGINYNGVDIYTHNTSVNLNTYRFVIKEIFFNENAQADFYILICSAYEWELSFVQEYINRNKNTDINYVFTNIDKDRFLKINKVFHRAGRKVFRLDASENPMEPTLWNCDTYSCIFSRYIPGFYAKKDMYKSKRKKGSLLCIVSLSTVVSILLATVIYLCFYEKDLKVSAEPTTSTEATEYETPKVSYDVNNDGRFDVADISFLQRLLSENAEQESGTGSEKSTNPSSEQTENKTTGDTQ